MSISPETVPTDEASNASTSRRAVGRVERASDLALRREEELRLAPESLGNRCTRLLGGIRHRDFDGVPVHADRHRQRGAGDVLWEKRHGGRIELGPAQVGQRDPQLFGKGARERCVADDAPLEEQLPEPAPARRLVRQCPYDRLAVDRIVADEQLTETGSGRLIGSVSRARCCAAHRGVVVGGAAHGLPVGRALPTQHSSRHSIMLTMPHHWPGNRASTLTQRLPALLRPITRYGSSINQEVWQLAVW